MVLTLISYKEVFPEALINGLKAVCGEGVGVLLQQLLAICSSTNEDRKRESLERWFESNVRNLGVPCTNALVKAYEWLKQADKC